MSLYYPGMEFDLPEENRYLSTKKNNKSKNFKGKDNDRNQSR